MKTGLLVLVFAALGGVLACSQPRSISRVTKASTPTPAALALDQIFKSPLYAYTIRYNHTWTVRQLPSQAGFLDFFTLPNATMAVSSDRVLPGTDTERIVRSTIDTYQRVNFQGMERVGTIDVGGGQGQLLHLVTYVTASGETVPQPQTPDAKPRNLYQAFYLAGDRSFTFSMAWPQSDTTDYLTLFRTVLRTFTLGGTT